LETSLSLIGPGVAHEGSLGGAPLSLAPDPSMRRFPETLY
jgi:hypothetical protein